MRRTAHMGKRWGRAMLVTVCSWLRLATRASVHEGTRFLRPRHKGFGLLVWLAGVRGMGLKGVLMTKLGGGGCSVTRPASFAFTSSAGGI